MRLGGYLFPDALYYDKNHYWASYENGLVSIGATDFTQKSAGEVIYFQAPSVGELIEQGQPFASLESGKWVGRVYAPVSGEIVIVNSQVVERPVLINEDPYGVGWLVKVKPRDLKELESLMRVNTPEFNTWIQKELAKS